MWTSTMEFSPGRVMLTRVLGQFWHGAYFSSFAPLQVQNVPRKSLPAQNWVRVRNRLAGISGSDLHLIYADGDFRTALAALPDYRRVYPGHEVVGEVIEVGEDVTQVRVGDRVVLQNDPNCLSTGAQPICRSCAAGNYNLCEQGHLSGPEPIGGGWSEEMLLHEQQLFRVPPELSDEQAVLLEPSSVAIHAVLRHLPGDPQPDEHVLITGAGTMGLLVLQVLRALAPQTRISVMARHSFQVEQATRMGADHILYPQDTYRSVKLLTGAKLYKGMFGNQMLLGGYDAVYDTIGTQRTLHDALRWTRAGGTIVMLGQSLHVMRIDLTPVWFQEVSLIGSVGHGMEMWPIGSQQRRSTFAIAADLMEQGQIHPEKLITHRFALTNFREAFSTAAGKTRTRAIKVIFDYALLPASVVPNVRAAGRQRRPVRTTAAWPTEDQVGQGIQATPESEQWEPVGSPEGHTWSHSVQPLPQIYIAQEEQFGESAYGFSESAAPVADAPPAEYAFPPTPYLTEEPRQDQAFTDEPTPHTTLTDSPAPQNVIEEEGQRESEGEGQVPVEQQMEPQPNIVADAAQASEDEGDVKTVVVPKPVRSRARAAMRKITEDQGHSADIDATKDAP